MDLNHHPHQPLIDDDELRCEEIGPSTRMMLIESDPEGGIFYQFGRRQPRCLQFPESYGLTLYGLIDLPNLACFFDIEQNRLLGLAAYVSAGTRLFLFGSDWGRWLDEDGQQHLANEPTALMHQWRVPVHLQESKNQITVDFTINIYQREHFTKELRDCFREMRHMRHSLNLIFHYPSGNFVTSRLVIHDERTGRMNFVFDIHGFPLVWPDRAKAKLVTPEEHSQTESKAERISRAASGTKAQPSSASAGIPPHAGNNGRYAFKPAKPQRQQARPPEAPRILTPQAAKPAVERPAEKSAVPETTHLSTHELIAMLSTETDSARRWRMIEPNLMLGRPERTYPLLTHYCDLIAERTCDWPAPRLKVAFAHQPGTMLVAVMHHWSNNQILAVAEANAESDKIIDWLRVREIERLLEKDLDRDPVTADEARKLLNLDRNADAMAIKKTWRTLLSFINADLGRSVERAIHRRKDEIAKHLQAARNILLKRGG